MKRIAVISSLMAATTAALTSCASAQSDPLIKAIQRGENELVLKLLKEEGKVNRRFEFKVSPLAIAVGWSQLEVARTLLQAGADPNVMDRFGVSIWMQASALKDPATKEAMIKLLLEHGCKPHDPSRPSEPNPFEKALKTPNPAPSVPSHQHDEAQDQQKLVYVLKILEREPQDLNKVDQSGMTMLMRGAGDGNVSAVRHFLAKGSHVGVKDYDGKTALDYARAVTNRPPEVQARLVELLQAAEQNLANGAGVTYQAAPRPLNGLTAIKEAKDNPQPLDYFEAIAAFQKFATLTEYQQMVLGRRAARWLRGNESIAGWAQQLLVANTNSQVQLALIEMLTSAQNNQALSRQTIGQLEQAETDPKKLQIYKQMKP